MSNEPAPVNLSTIFKITQDVEHEVRTGNPTLGGKALEAAVGVAVSAALTAPEQRIAYLRRTIQHVIESPGFPRNARSLLRLALKSDSEMA